MADDYRGGTIRSISRLKWDCECGQPAIYRVERWNHSPPPGVLRGGTISSNYCEEHLPADARKVWDNAAG